jgi:integrase
VPPKPYPTFPLTPHASGKWMKKIGGKLYYFGNWGRRVNGKIQRLPGDGWEEARDLYKAQADDLHAGRKPAPALDEKLTVAELCNEFLTAMFRRSQAGKRMTARSFAEYKLSAARLCAAVGKRRQVASLRAADFTSLGLDLAANYSVARQGHEVQKIKTLFTWGLKNELIKAVPNYGDFKKPSTTERRIARAAGGKRLFTAEEIRRLLDGDTMAGDDGETVTVAPASTQLRAMILLGINCGFGNMDVSSLPQSAIDGKNCVIDFPRPKTGIDRRCPLWPETRGAIQAARDERPEAKDKADADCIFITKQGNRWVRERVTKINPEGPDDDFSNRKTVMINSVALEFGKRLRTLHINGRKGLGFYALRHTFRTVADGSKDFPAARLIMGHADSSIDAVYREEIDDDRLHAVTEHVRKWLFGSAVK